MADPIKDLYKTLQSSGLFVDEADLRTQLKSAPKDVYALVEKDGLFVDYSDFESALALKKKRRCAAYWKRFSKWWAANFPIHLHVHFALAVIRKSKESPD